MTADQYGALPSLHIGWAVWTALVGYRLVRSRALGLAWLGYPLVTCAVVVATGTVTCSSGAVAGGALALVAQELTHVQRRPKPIQEQAERDRPVNGEWDQVAV